MINSGFSIWRKLLTVGTAAGLSASVMAHPGHDLAEHGSAHILTSPYHVSVLLVLGLILFAIGQVARTARAQRILRVAGTVAIAIAAVIWTLLPG